MRARTLTFTLSFTLLAALPTASPAAITGTIMAKDGHPLAARVSYLPLETASTRSARLLSPNPERKAGGSVQTDAKGSFSIDTGTDPVVALRIDAKGYAPAQLRAERNEDAGVIALTAAETKQGTITAAGKPVPGATVIWMNNAGAESIATTDANGRYTAPDPSKWAVRVIVVHPDFALLDEETGPFSPNARKGLNRTLEAGVAIKGRVVAADGKTPVAGAAISVDRWPLTVSSEDGSFSVAHARSRWEMLAARLDNQVALRAQSDASTTLRLAKGGMVSGTVRDSRTHLPLAFAEVRVGQRALFGGEPAHSAFTDAKGNYAMGGIPPGNYQIIAMRPGYAEQEPLPLSLTAGQNAQRALMQTPLARIWGSVIDEDKQPVAAAVVSAEPLSRDPMMGMMRFRPAGPSYSGPDGRFQLRLEGDSDVQVEAEKKGFPSARSSTVRAAAGERKGPVVITVPRGIAISGTVRDRAGKPLSGVAVSAMESEASGMNIRRMMLNLMAQPDDDQVRTASDGSFTLRLKEGTYDVVFKREGFSTKNLRGQKVSVAAKPIEVVLDPGVEISGRVTRNGAGIEGVNVSAISQDQQGTTVTAADGSFTLADLTPGPVMLNINKPDAFVLQMRNVTAPAKDVVFEFPAGGRVSGRVVDKTTHQPLTNFQVGMSGVRGGGGFVMALPGQMRSFTSDDGSFAIENVPPGAQTLLARAPGYLEGRLPNVNVEDGKSVANVEIELDRGARVTGKVTGPDGAPLSGARVRVAPAAMMGGRVMGESAAATATDSNGEYVLEPVEAGERTIDFSASGLVATQKTIQITGKEARLDAQLSAGLRVSGQVVTESGVPVADANVSARSAAAGGFGRSARTDAAGSFTLEGLSPGHYTFDASKSGYSNGTLRDVDITTSGPLRIALKTGGVIYGHVSGLPENDLVNVTVNARGANGSANAPVDASGNYRIEGSPVGTVRVSAYLSRGFVEGRSSDLKTIEIEAGGSTQVDIEFTANTVLRGRVTRDGKPIAGAMVRFMPRNPGSATTAAGTTDENGSYSISGLSDGKYTVAVIDMQRVTPYTSTYDVRGSATYDIDIRAAVVRGRVVDAGNGQPIGKSIVQLRGGGPDGMLGARTAETDESGAFTIDLVAPGTYDATASKDGYGTEVRQYIVTENAAEPLEFKLARNDGVTLRVVDARDQRTLNASVVVRDAGDRVVFEDFFRMGSAEPMRIALAPGQYRAWVTAMGYAPRLVTITSPSQQVVALTPGGSITIRSKGSAPRRGRLIDASGMQYARDSRQSGFRIDPAPGVTTLQAVAPGSYTLQILGEGDAVVASYPVTVVEGQAAGVEVN